MTNLKVGQRVRVYGAMLDLSDGGYVQTNVDLEVIEAGEFAVALKCGDYRYEAHPKQCRRLVPRKRRAWWLSIHDCSYPRVHKQHEPGMVCGSGCKIEWVQVREVRGKASKA